jgi:hypothetical protein
MHEVKPRSLGGKISLENSIAVCGELGTGHECHGLAQRREMKVTAMWTDMLGNVRRSWLPVTEAARKWWEAEC